MKLVSKRSGNFIAAPYSVDGVKEGVPFEVDDERAAALFDKYGSLFEEYKEKPKPKKRPAPVNKMKAGPRNK